MIYVFHLLDKPGVAALRDRVRPKAHLTQLAERIAFAGPLARDGAGCPSPS